MLFVIILMVLILMIFRKQEIEFTREGSKAEMIFCLSWYSLYFILALISNASDIAFVNEATNWLLLVLLPLLLIAGIRKEKFPFAFYLWDSTAGNIMDSVKAVLMDQAVTGCSLGLIYYKSNKNLWSSIILHAFINASIMSFSVTFSGA